MATLHSFNQFSIYSIQFVLPVKFLPSKIVKSYIHIYIYVYIFIYYIYDIYIFNIYVCNIYIYMIYIYNIYLPWSSKCRITNDIFDWFIFLLLIFCSITLHFTVNITNFNNYLINIMKLQAFMILWSVLKPPLLLGSRFVANFFSFSPIYIYIYIYIYMHFS